MTNPNPLSKLLSDWLPECDVGVMNHGFAAHGRDYVIVVQDSLGADPGTHALTFTHVVEARCRTAVTPQGWVQSWGDEFTDYRAWEQAGEPQGYVWGTNWSNAFPGFHALARSDEAAEWTAKLGKPMWAMQLETDRFSLSLIFHAVRSRKLSDDASTMRQVNIPL